MVKNSGIPLYLLFLLVSFASVGGVLCTPALPQIEVFFAVSYEKAQLVITSYLVGYALGQLPYGPLANGLGRKKTLYIGVAFSIVGCLLSVLSFFTVSFSLLILGRWIQALGACVGMKVSFTMIADVYDQVRAAKEISKTIIAFAIMPGLAIALGGFLTQIIG